MIYVIYLSTRDHPVSHLPLFEVVYNLNTRRPSPGKHALRSFRSCRSYGVNSATRATVDRFEIGKIPWLSKGLDHGVGIVFLIEVYLICFFSICFSFSFLVFLPSGGWVTTFSSPEKKTPPKRGRLWSLSSAVRGHVRGVRRLRWRYNLQLFFPRLFWSIIFRDSGRLQSMMSFMHEVMIVNPELRSAYW